MVDDKVYPMFVPLVLHRHSVDMIPQINRNNNTYINSFKTFFPQQGKNTKPACAG